MSSRSTMATGFSMGGAFDPYHRWLGISPKDQPPNHYRLLGLERFESDHDVIDEAADRQMAHVRTHQTGQYSDLSQKLLSEITVARRCLLNDVMRRDYDAELRSKEPSDKPEEKPRKVKALPVATALPTTPTAKPAVEQPAIRAQAPVDTLPPAPQTFVDAAKPSAHKGPRRNANPIIPLVIVSGAGGAILLAAVAFVAAAMFYDTQEVTRAETASSGSLSRSAVQDRGPSLPRPSANVPPEPSPPRTPYVPPSPEIEPPGFPQPSPPVQIPETIQNETSSDLHPVPRGDTVTAEDIPQDRAAKIVDGIAGAILALQLSNGKGTTAFLVDDRGWIVSNYRFVAGAKSATVALGQVATQDVRGVLAADPRCDLVLLDIGEPDSNMTPAKLAAEPWHQREIILCSSSPDPGSHYCSIGQAYGPMSGAQVRQRMQTEEGFDLFGDRGYDEQTYWVNVTADTLDGRLGAPIIDTQSQVIGVATWHSPQQKSVACAVSVVEVHKLMRRVNGRIYPLSSLNSKSLLPPQ